MSGGDYNNQRSPGRSRSRSRSPNRLSPSHNNQQSSQRNYYRSSSKNNSSFNFHDRRNNRYPSNHSNNNNGNDHRNNNGGDRLSQAVNLYSDRELGLKYRWEKTVHVSNIPYDMRWTALKDLFRTEVGEVMYTEVFERDGKSLGCGSVEFRTVEEAKRAVDKMHQFEYGGRKLAVKLDEEGYRTRRAKYQSLEGRLSQKGNMFQHQSNLSNQFGNNNGDSGNLSRSSQIAGLNSVGVSLSGYSSVAGIPPYMLQRLGIEGPITNKVFVANLDFKCDEKKVREVFSLAGRVRDVTLKRTKEGQSRGMAIVEYEYPLEAVQAVSMYNEQQLYDRIMAVKIDLKDEGKDDGRPMKLPSGLKSIGVGLGIAGNPLRASNVNQLEQPISQINPINSNPMQNITPNVSDYMNHSDLTALQALSQLSPSAISALTQLAASGFTGLNSLTGLQSTNLGLGSSSLGLDLHSNSNSLYSSLAGGYSNYQQSSGLSGVSQLSSQLSGSFYKDDDARLGQSAPVGVSTVSSVRTQPTSSFAGGRSVLGTGVGGVSGLGSSLSAYPTSNTNTQRSVGGVLSTGGVAGQNSGIYDRSRGRSPYR
ncbi:unnamed protein product [Rotaria socialis]|uniref:RRM domain-containing protein n=5 Tax=Rotaria TaxID=231623 RepID=A0A818HGA5_9BILA|nr:unnamed protein product [Rotaria socialis]CAF3369553.1 unnamed protein product [Rotaria socialis]CAF3421281.1 unnamed protein product [Rotaria socialis]CAF3503964.1 unnamed protein product [Rotaria socialis]CAF4122409.1 unnamed protein product [Rotaria socialis]